MIDSSTLKGTAVEEAAIRICKENDVPFVVATSKEADLLPLVHGFKQIYTKDKLPEKARVVVCGVGVDSTLFGPDVEVLLEVTNKSVDTE